MKKKLHHYKKQKVLKYKMEKHNNYETICCFVNDIHCDRLAGIAIHLDQKSKHCTPTDEDATL